MKTREEELAELEERMALARAELEAMAEEIGVGAGPLPARAKFFELRRRHLEEGIKGLLTKRASLVAYVEWDRRTKP